MIGRNRLTPDALFGGGVAILATALTLGILIGQALGWRLSIQLLYGALVLSGLVALIGILLLLRGVLGKAHSAAPAGRPRAPVGAVSPEGPASARTPPSTTFYASRLATFPVYGPHSIASPDVSGGWPKLLIRSAAAFLLPLGSVMTKIEPPHRRALIQVLQSTSFPGGQVITNWITPTGSYQTTVNAVYEGVLQQGQLIKCWLQLPTLSAPTIRVIGDAYLNPLNGAPTSEWPLSLEVLVRFWAALLSLAATSVDQSVLQRFVMPPPTATTIEVHVEAGSVPTMTPLDKCLDLSPLGSPTRQAPLQGMWTGSASLLKTLDSTEIALQALRDNALDWGYLDPDPGIDMLRNAIVPGSRHTQET